MTSIDKVELERANSDGEIAQRRKMNRLEGLF